MLLMLKTLDQKMFRVEVDNSESVSEFLSRIEEQVGTENIYKVIYQGKLLKEGNILADYNIDPNKCLILIISKPTKNKTRTKDGHSALVRPTTLSLPMHVESSSPRLVHGSQDEGPDSGYSSPLEQRMVPDDDHHHAIINMNGIDDTDKHYVTDDEFLIALDVIVSSDYLKLNCDNETINKKGVMKAVLEYSYDERPKEHLKSYIIGKVDLIEDASLNGTQLYAFINDIEDIYKQKRLERHRNKMRFDYNAYNEMMFDIEDLDEEQTKVIKPLSDRPPTPLELEDFKKVSSSVRRGVTRSEIEFAMRDSFESPGQASQYLTEKGFQHEQVEIALKTSLGSPDAAVNYLMTGNLPTHHQNPLAFLRENQEFRNIRVMVKRNPELLSSIILSFGSKNPHLHDLIYQNKLSFVRMINEPETEYYIPEHQKHCR